jgi:hypothetical protein
MRFWNAILLGILMTGAVAVAQSEHPGNDLSDAEINDIIRRFAAKESAFAKARETYTYRQSVRIQDLGFDGREVGRWEEVVDVLFDDQGRRKENVIRAPIASLRNFQMDPQDLEDMRHTMPFVLTTEDLPLYDVRYLGREMVDELPTYAFAVKPKKLEEGKRYFSGIVWVDDLDLQIVKSYGRAMGIVAKGHVFPKFETYRQPIDGVYWFPVYTIAEDTLHFDSGDVKIRQVARYEEYKQFKTDVTITFDIPEEDLIAPPSQEPQQ